MHVRFRGHTVRCLGPGCPLASCSSLLCILMILQVRSWTPWSPKGSHVSIPSLDLSKTSLSKDPNKTLNWTFEVVLLFSYQDASAVPTQLPYVITSEISCQQLISVNFYCIHSDNTIRIIGALSDTTFIFAWKRAKNKTEKEGFEPSHRANDLHP